MYYPCSENKGADQLCGYRTADLRLCFRICKKPVFLMTRLILSDHDIKHKQPRTTTNLRRYCKLCFVLFRNYFIAGFRDLVALHRLFIMILSLFHTACDPNPLNLIGILFMFDGADTVYGARGRGECFTFHNRVCYFLLFGFEQNDYS